MILSQLPLHLLLLLNKIKYKLLLELQLNYLYYFIKINRTLDILTGYALALA